MSALMIATITVKDPEKFRRYLAKTQEVAQPYGAELLFQGKTDRSLNGRDTDHDLAVIAKFPSLEKINEWINSEQYQPLIALRDEGADINMISYELLD